MSEITLRCNMCGSEFEDDYDLATCIYDKENDEFHDGCPHCMTDEYIMSINPNQQPTNLTDSFMGDKDNLIKELKKLNNDYQ